MAVLTDDLLFGSRLQATLEAAGHAVTLADEERLRELLAEGSSERPDLLLLDLTDPSQPHDWRLDELVRREGLEGVRTGAFYSHVDVTTRERAERAGVGLVVPRSRIAREGAEVVARMLGA